MEKNVLRERALVGLVFTAMLVACSGTPATGGTSSTSGGSTADPNPTCEKLCAHIDATPCAKKNAAPLADCMTKCATFTAKPSCTSQANALIGCCTGKDLTGHCDDNVLDPGDCDDDDVCDAEGKALDACK